MAEDRQKSNTRSMRLSVRSAYAPPVLKTYGPVGVLTQGASGSMGMEGGGMGMGMGMVGLGGGFGLP